MPKTNQNSTSSIGEDIAFVPKPTIYEALVAAQVSAAAVEKDAKNAHQGYAYASSESIIAEARSALGGHGLAVVRTRSSVTWEDGREVASPRGPKLVRVGLVRCDYLLVHEHGETLTLTAETPAVVESGRPEDKAVATALTYSLGYFLRDLLCLPRVEAGTDVDQRDDRSHAPPPPVAPSALAVELADKAAAAQSHGEWAKVRDAAASASLNATDAALVRKALGSSAHRKAPEVTS